MQPRSHAARLLRDVRGGTIELIIIVGLFVFGIVVGVRHLASGTNVALQCHGARIQNPDGSFSCGGGGALPNGSTATGSNPQTPAPCRGGFCMCFVAGTPVLTATGLQAIETIAPGTLVFTRGQEGEPPVLRPVVRTFVNRARALVKLTVTTNAGFSETFSTTANHPFYVAGRGWIEAGDLDPGADALLDHAGRPLAITEAETTPGRVLVYNLEVGEHHTYFVGATGVWVHNVTLSEIMNGGRPTLVRVGQWQYRDPVGRVRPIKILDQTGTVIGRTNAQVLRLNADGTYDVQWTSAGTVHQGRSDGRGRTRPYPPIGIRHPINHNGRPLDALLVQRNPDGSHEVEANLNGERRSGRLPMGSNVVNWYPMPPRGNYVPNTPIAGHVPVQTPTADGGLVTTIGNIEIVHPAPTPLDALPHVHNDRVNFVNGVLNDLTMIQSTPSGQALLNSLQNNGGHSAGPVRIQFTPGYNYFADDEAAASHGNDGDFDHSNTLPGTGAGATVTYNPAIQGTPVRPTGDNTGTDAGLVRYLSQGSLRAHQWPSDSILFHELVHADDARRGIGFDNSFGGSHVGPSEERAVGLGDFSAAPYSENTYLVDRGLPPRAFYGAAGAGEVYSTTATRNGLDAGWLLSSHTGPGTPTSRPPVPPKPKITPASSVAGLYATSSNASTTSISGDSIANFMDNDLGGPGGAGGGGGGPPGPGGDGGPPGGGGGGPPGGSGGPSGTGMGGPSGTGTPNTGGFVAGGPTPSGSGSGVPSTTSAPTNTAGLYDHMNVSSDSLGSQNSYAPSDWSAAQGSHHGALQTGASHPPAPPRPTTEPNTNAGSSDGVPSTAPPSNGPLIVPGGPQPGSQDCG